MPTHILNRLLPMSLRFKLRRAALSTIPSMRHLDIPARLRNMQRIGFRPAAIVDVGAAQGGWARLASGIWPDATINGFEPNQTNVPLLERARMDLPKFSYRTALLGPKAATVNYTDRSDQTSLLEENNDTTGNQQAQMFTLDELIASGEVPSPQLIKLDVQGYELEVLKGAAKALETCEAVLAEVSFFRFFPAMPTADEVIDFMRERGFAWYDVMGILRCQQTDALGQMDFMFLKADHPLRAKIHPC